MNLIQKIIKNYFSVLTGVGDQYFSNQEAQNSPTGLHSKLLQHLMWRNIVILTPADSRWGLTGAYDIINNTKSIGIIPGVERLNFSANIFSAGKPIHLNFQVTTLMT